MNIHRFCLSLQTLILWAVNRYFADESAIFVNRYCGF
jgi:hypothetical protein